MLRPAPEQLHRLVLDQTGPTDPHSAIEATGERHQAWMRELLPVISTGRPGARGG